MTNEEKKLKFSRVKRKSNRGVEKERIKPIDVRLAILRVRYSCVMSVSRVCRIGFECTATRERNVPSLSRLVWMTSDGRSPARRLLGLRASLPLAGCLSWWWRWSQCSTTVTRPLLSMIFHEGVSSCNSSEWIVSHTMRGIAEMAVGTKPNSPHQMMMIFCLQTNTHNSLLREPIDSLLSLSLSMNGTHTHTQTRRRGERERVWRSPVNVASAVRAFSLSLSRSLSSTPFCTNCLRKLSFPLEHFAVPLKTPYAHAERITRGCKEPIAADKVLKAYDEPSQAIRVTGWWWLLKGEHTPRRFFAHRLTARPCHVYETGILGFKRNADGSNKLFYCNFFVSIIWRVQTSIAKNGQSLGQTSK